MLTAYKGNRCGPGRTGISDEMELLIALYYFANQETYREIGHLFNVTESTALAAVRLITNWLCSTAHVFIRWPNRQAALAIEAGFKAKRNVPRVTGAMTGVTSRSLRHMSIQSIT